MRKFYICLLILVLFYGCKTIIHMPDPVIKLETEGMLIFKQDDIYFLPAEPNCLLPPEFTEYNLKGLVVSPTKKMDRSVMLEMGAVEYGCSSPPGIPYRCRTGRTDDNYYIKHDSCYVIYASIKLWAYGKLSISFGLGDPILNYFTWNMIVDGFPIKCNILGSTPCYFEILNAKKVDRKHLYEYFNDKCQIKNQDSFKFLSNV